jgi:hypothetical protein
MGDFIGQLFIEMLFSVIEYPGAYIHWLLRKKQMPFKEIEERYFGINLLLSLLLYGTIAWIICTIM